MKKQILSLLLCVAMLLTLLPQTVLLASAETFANNNVSLKSQDSRSGNAGITVGSEITLGTYNGNAITWVCVLIDENGPLMLSKEILCKKEYDAPGKSAAYHGDGWGYIRKESGSNCWYDSNIRQWLNTSGTVNWSHCAPSYKNEPGFLSGFSANELACIKQVTQKVYINAWETNRAG